ncbi:branched-chain amino acid ABC transporter substrate-binding protein [Sphaerisporangium siamense]|uniref:Branched-chain amino acid transport system substrate-binding protein n=1 Tax=Sphaerisporangium siamense TaxID=795645 RepID=A0A7W7GCA7_9ACTN|nr:ABC transporter substrate-binding protein [Sphaerisporangium siamense]MBB4701831.1 branched-chain amino acid transport system substrate-binding protein [Sphaerisporangium siamense]GII84261.1 branched-chain amino acid ABC transporter substrate-binding protein [Sphaerisporangium siamense]
MKRSLTSIVAVAALALATSACGGDSGTDGPIKVGAINGITGLFQTPEVPKAVQAVFDEVNKAGGINGRKLEFITKDDAMNPQRSTEAAIDLIESEEVVALVGSSSAVDCGLNRATYSNNKIVSIPAVGVDATCFTSPNIAPVNPGPFKLITAMLYYASETLKRDKVCMYYTVLPGSGGGIENAIKEWTDITGKSLTVKDLSVGQGDPTPYLVKAKAAGCQAILYNAQVGPWFAQAATQGMTDVDFIMGANSYTDANAALIPAKINAYAGTEWQPYTDATLPGNERWSKVVDANKIQRTAFSQGAVMAADVFVEVLKGIKGDITRESVTNAFKNMKPIQYPMVGTPYVFGPGNAHNPIEGSRFVKVLNGKWQVLPEGFIVPGKN